MLPCNNCAYKDAIPGNAHIKCVFDWGKSKKELKANVPPHALQWFLFPLNYDPTWGPVKCPAKSKKRDPEMVMKLDPMMELLSLLRRQA